MFFDYSLDILVLMGFDDCFKQVSPSFERILGWKKDEVISRSYLDFVHPDDNKISLAEVKAHESDTAAYQFENRYRHEDGSYRWISWNSHSIPEKQIVVSIGRDITKRKQVEKR